MESNEKKVVRKGLMAAVLLSLAGVAAANNLALGRCQEFNWKPGDVIPVEAAMYQHVSIKLPEDSLDVVWAAKGLWEMEFVKNYIFAKSLTPQPQGAATTLTAIGQSGNAYEFAVKRVAQPRTQCVVVLTSGGMINRSAWQSDAQQGPSTQAQALTAQVARLSAEKAELQRDADRKARETLRMYRGAINSGYEWTTGEGWFASGGSVIESVYDDGRFTFVRLKSDARGLMVIQGEIDGKKEILESTYDQGTRTHKISGIFPKFVLRAGDSELVITRKAG